MTKNVYIHIPFCKSKCHYCSFISFNKLDLKDQYLNALTKEIKYYYKNEELNTLYFGGGTPSNLTADEFKRIINLFNITDNTEITTELNPENLTLTYLKSLKNTGINRISIGAQTFDDKILRQINRRHNSQDIINSVNYSHQAGFNNISLDFIYGLPNQTMKMFEKDIINAINLNIQHISLYGLSIEKGCYFYNNPPQNMADDETQAQMYKNIVDILKTNGFNHYEISNFSKNGYESRHNLNYWNNEQYYGFGTAAHGYIDNIRYGNCNTIEQYLKFPTKKVQTRNETQKDKLEEEIFLGFRKVSGINIHEINSKYKINFDEKYKKILNKYISLNLIHKTTNGYKLSINGILLSNTILADFLE